MASIYRCASLSNERDRPLLLARPDFLELSERAVRPGRSLVAVRDGRVAGFATADPIDDGLELEALFVHPGEMRRGVGTALVSAVAGRARTRGFDSLWVSANVHALAFYRSTGFIEVGTVDLEFGPAPRMVRPT